MSLKDHAVKLLADPDYLEDAVIFADVGNTVVGSLLNLTFRTPRQYCEQAVRDALEELLTERRLA